LFHSLPNRCLELPEVGIDFDARFHRERGARQEKQLTLAGESGESSDVDPDSVDGEHGARLTRIPEETRAAHQFQVPRGGAEGPPGENLVL